MENPEIDQGQPAEEPTSDPVAEGGEAAVEQEGTVAVDADPTDAKGEETGEGNPYADLLKEYVPQKDYVHAQQKITQQGQELSARDAEVTQLRADMQKLQAQVSTKSLITEDDGYEGVDEDAVSGRVASELQQIRADIAAQNERLNAQDDVIISSATESQRVKGVQAVKQNLGLNDEMALAVQTLREQGKMNEAIALAGKAAVIAQAERDKEALAGRQEEPIISGAQASGDVDVEPEPLKVEDLPEEIDKRGGFHLKRMMKRFGL